MKTKEQVMGYLAARNWYPPFVANLKARYNLTPGEFWDRCSEARRKGLISWAFNWGDTHQGEMFWLDAHDAYCRWYTL